MEARPGVCRCKAVDDLLAHAVEVYSGMPQLFRRLTIEIHCSSRPSTTPRSDAGGVVRKFEFVAISAVAFSSARERGLPRRDARRSTAFRDEHRNG